MNRKTSVTVILLSLYAAVLISSVSACSPFYGFNDMVDINVIFSVGKSFWRGRLVYRDLFEHKGPIMYAITAAAALISSADLRGVWVIEIIAAVLFALTAFRILRLLNPKASGLLLPPVLYLIYHSPSFAGGTAEEFCLPLLSLSLLVSVKAMLERRMPSFKESLLIGITSAGMFWIKYNMIGFYIGLFLAFLVFALKDRTMKRLMTAVGGVACGVLLVTVPILVFFGANGALDDLFQVYYLDNVTNYANRLDFLYQGYYALTGTMDTVRANPIVWFVIALGLIRLYAQRPHRRVFVLAVLSAFFTAWFVYCGGMKFPYYGFILLLFAVFAAAYEPQFRYAPALTVCTALLFAALTVPYHKLSHPDAPEDFVQYRLTREIPEDASLLTYASFDQGFYTAGKLYPTEYHFCMTNCMIDEASAAQTACLEEGRTDYVVTREDLGSYTKYEQITEDGEWKLYRRIK